MRAKLFESIARDLEKRITANELDPLPSITELAVHQRVSYRTMWKAVQVLVRKGIIAVFAGRKISIVARDPSGRAPSPGSSGRFFDIIKGRIVDGIYKVGDRFPKAGYLVQAEHVSTATVRKAFLLLRNENLAYCRKRRWIVGPPPAFAQTQSGGAAKDASPVVLLLCPSPDSWYLAFESMFTNNFMVPLRNELIHYAVHLEPVLKDKGAPEVSMVPAGLNSIAQKIRSLGERYWGTLIICIDPEKNRLAQAIQVLCRFRKPVVYFDCTNQGSSLAGAGIDARHGYFRPHLDEQSSVALALTELSRRGHRTVGVHGWDRAEWARRRLELIRKCAAEMTPRIAVVASGPSEPYWEFPPYSRVPIDTAQPQYQMLGDVEQYVRDAGSLSFKALGRTVQNKTPALCDMLREHHPTALIALNDESAARYFFWSRLVGIKIPEDLSVISFDNAPESILFPISTIDFGFGRLGYLAAHIFIHDFTIRARRDGAVPGSCTVIDRGSIGAPAASGALRRLLCG